MTTTSPIHRKCANQNLWYRVSKRSISLACNCTHNPLAKLRTPFPKTKKGGEASPEASHGRFQPESGRDKGAVCSGLVGYQIAMFFLVAFWFTSTIAPPHSYEKAQAKTWELTPSSEVYSEGAPVHMYYDAKEHSDATDTSEVSNNCCFINCAHTRPLMFVGTHTSCYLCRLVEYRHLKTTITMFFLGAVHRVHMHPL